MNHFLGFFADDQTRKQVVKKVGKVSTIFSGMHIQVRWIKPSNYHIKLQNLQGPVGPIKQIYIKKKIQDILKEPIQLSLGGIKLGSNRNLRGLLYLEIDDGGERLRELRYEMLNTLKIKDNVQFVPHIALGRINKDLSRQEISNILKDVENISKNESSSKHKFYLKEIELVKIQEGNYTVLKKFKTES
jgi:2'-5' RNA ligase